MEYSEIDWSKRGEDLFMQLETYRRRRILSNIEQLDRLLEQIKNQDIFNHQDFRKIRSRVGSQQEWANWVGVSQATIGNYERSITYPNKQTRANIASAIKRAKEIEARKLDARQGPKIDVDAGEAKNALDTSILNAALTDFRFDPDEQRVVSVPFSTDVAQSELETIEEDRRDLLSALCAQSRDIALSLKDGANANLVRMVGALESYADEAERERANPRKLLRLGSNIYRASVSDDISFTIREWDKVALEGFAEDHTELMRLYYREALAKAQQIDASLVPDGAEIPEASDFVEIADLIASAKDQDGESVFAEDISTLLRDISRDIEENKEAEILSTDPERKKALRRRRIEAVKNGSILVGRFLVFTALFVSVDPSVALGTASSIATIVGVVEQAAPGTVRKYYERIREMLPFLPKFPSKK